MDRYIGMQEASAGDESGLKVVARGKSDEAGDVELVN